jgi:hypothetical protein
MQRMLMCDLDSKKSYFAKDKFMKRDLSVRLFFVNLGIISCLFVQT